MSALEQHPVVVTVAPCGAEVTRADNPAVPYTAEEIAAEVAAAAEAGATIAHLHAREPDGAPTHRREVFAGIVAAIRASVDVVCNVSTGGAVWMTMDERLECMGSGADMAGLETGSLNFAGEPFVTSGADTRRVIDEADARGMPLEAECFDLGHVAEAARLQRDGAPIRLVNLVLGVPGGAPAHAGALQALAAEVPAGTPWTVTAVGRHQRTMLSLAVLLGAAGIRVGLEDSVYVAKGTLAAGNADLVARACELVRLLGREVATVDQTRELLGIEKGAAV